MPDRSVLPYGSWPSPITVALAVAGSLSVREPRFDGSDVYWTEGRPQEGGRQVIVRWRDGQLEDVTPPDFNARTMVHEYGGGAYAVDQAVVYFSNLADGRLYGQALGGQPVAITPPGPRRYADLVVDAARQRLLCVLEDHSGLEHEAAPAEGGRVAEPTNSLVAVDTVSGDIRELAAGYDFYSTPRPSPDGRWLAWLCWRHPNMPWDGTELWLAEVTGDGSLGAARLVAGGPEESIVQPEWGPDGALVFASDRSGWWNLYRLDGPMASDAVPLAPMAAEFAGPQWVFGLSWYGIDDDGTIYATARRHGRTELWRIPPVGGEPAQLTLEQTELRDLSVRGGKVLFVGASPTEQQAVVLLDPASGAQQVLRRSAELTVDRRHVSVPRHVSFPTAGGRTAHALFYPPTNPDCAGPPGERPPLVVMSHGGPTSAAWTGLNLEKQLFTSRGFAVVDVDYGGSVGYGREYMRRLDGQWGIVDVEDCLNAARYLAEKGEVDAARMAIRGGSAGGYTTLCELVWHDLFACGASHYGVGDLEALARDTHKFESRYLDRLVAPYPEHIEVYRARSPIHHSERIGVPLIVLQGLEDRVVPPAQAEQLVAALREKGIAHAYLAFEGEGHGFRRAENITRALEAELSFYAQVLGFELADDIAPVPVEGTAAARRAQRPRVGN